MAYISREEFNITFATSGTLANSADIPATFQGGFIKHIRFTAVSTSANVSATPAIYDVEGNQLWTFGVCMSSTAGSSHYLTAADVPLVPGCSIRVTFGGIPGSASALSATPLTANVIVWTV
jgi:hypothetical protein